MKVAAHVLMYDAQKWILRMIENSAPFVDRIYVAYSPVPWTKYNKNAREEFSNQCTPEILENSNYQDRIEIIEDTWEAEEDQRNACLERARKDGMDFLLIHDADEFYLAKDYQRLIALLEKNSSYELFKTPWCSFWKSFSWVIKGSGRHNIVGYPQVAVNCNSNIAFESARATTEARELTLDCLCYHASYVLTDEEVWSKISTWGHAHQFDRKKWFETVWKQWTPRSRNLHPISPRDWPKAVEFKGQLPEVIADMASESTPTKSKGIWSWFS